MVTADTDAKLLELEDETFEAQSLRDWITGAGAQAWLASLLIHLIIMLLLALVLGTIQVVSHVVNAPSFETTPPEPTVEPTLVHFEPGDPPVDTTILNTETLEQFQAPAVTKEFYDHQKDFELATAGTSTNRLDPFGGLGGRGLGGQGLGDPHSGGTIRSSGSGPITRSGSGGPSDGFANRGKGSRDALSGTGATIPTERSVAAALNWIARHQNQNGSWSLDHRARCKGGSCSGAGEVSSDPAATALALLPFLAAGQTHESRGPYQRQIAAGLNWLVNNQKPNGDLSAGGASQMYTHGLATIALCEAYGMTQDSKIGLAAQAAINFIQTGQNREGSWRYAHGADDSDTSVHGWQVMALKSGQMAGLTVSEQSLAGSKNFLKLVGKGGSYREQFAYTPDSGPTLPMTSVGLLCTQYLGANRDDPVITGGVEYLLKNLPNEERRNVYYWYYATQVMHNVPGPQWDTWNRSMRRILVNTQDKLGCDAGSWDPQRPTPDAWGRQGGRLMVTSLSCLTLEVYYRYLPLYKIDKHDVE